MYSSSEWMEARLGRAPNLPDPGKAAQAALARAKVVGVFTPMKQNRELLVAGVRQPLTHEVKLATGTGGITGGLDLVTETEGLLVAILDATVGATVREAAGHLVVEVVGVRGGLDLDTDVVGVRGGLDLDTVEEVQWVREGMGVGELSAGAPVLREAVGVRVGVGVGEGVTVGVLLAGAGTMHSRVTDPAHPALPQAPTPPSGPVA